MAQLNSFEPVKILIVDDHPNTAAMLARVLCRLNHPVEVYTADSGEKALAIIDQHQVDIIITDFVMPGMNGLELIKRLNHIQKAVHVILITAYDIPGLSISAKRLGVKDYLVKPVQPDLVQMMVSRVIQDLQQVELIND
jgi:two-component system, response regulator YesN